MSDRKDQTQDSKGDKQVTLNMNSFVYDPNRSEYEKWWDRQPDSIKKDPELAARVAYNVGMMQGVSHCHEQIVTNLVHAKMVDVFKEGSSWHLAGCADEEETPDAT